MSKSEKLSNSKKVGVFFQRPGDIPAKVMVPAGTTMEEFLKLYNIGDEYEVTVNGATVNPEHVLKSKDNIRVGVKTKNG